MSVLANSRGFTTRGYASQMSTVLKFIVGYAQCFIFQISIISLELTSLRRLRLEFSFQTLKHSPKMLNIAHRSPTSFYI
jgi:hypothetical protein